MIEAAKAEQGELILVVLGPLTNVALACKLDSQLPSRGELLNTWQTPQGPQHSTIIQVLLYRVAVRSVSSSWLCGVQHKHIMFVCSTA